MLASLARTGVAVTAEEHRKAGGLADAVRDSGRRAVPGPDPRARRDDTFGVSGTGEAVMERFGLTAAGIADTVRQALVLKPVVRHSPVLERRATSQPEPGKRRRWQKQQAGTPHRCGGLCALPDSPLMAAIDESHAPGRARLAGAG